MTDHRPLLCIDMGNTSLRAAAWTGHGIAAQTRHLRMEEGEPAPAPLAQWVRALGPWRGCVAVVGRAAWREAIAALAREGGAGEPFFVAHGGWLPFAIRYEDDSCAGADRIANVAGLRARVGWPSASIDFGTATTIEVVDAHGDMAGGAIMPGAAMGLRALHEATGGRLPLLEPDAGFAAPIGRGTEHAMQVGAVLAHVRGAEAIVREMLAEAGAPEAPVVITGGLGPVLAPLVRIPARFMPDLTLAGAAALWEAARAAGTEHIAGTRSRKPAAEPREGRPSG
jgi:type III pantothenate kinase